METTRETRTLARLALVIACAGAVGCGGDDERAPAPGDTPPAAGFTADPAATGPRLWIDARLDGAGVVAEIWAAELGSVFGWSVHLGHDAAHVAPDAAALPAIDEAVLAPEEGDALHLVTIAAGDVGLGGTRQNPTLGGVELDAAARLAVVGLSVLGAGDSRLELSRVVVRRADGAWVAAAAGGGELKTIGGAP